MNPVYIEATTLSDAWYQSLFKIIDQGRIFTIDKGSYEGQKRLEFDFLTIRIKYPSIEPLLPQIENHYGIPNPVEDGYLDSYMPYLMTGEEKEGESYTYGSRICKHLVTGQAETWFLNQNKYILIQDEDAWLNDKIIHEENGNFYLNQMEYIIWNYKNKGPRSNQMVMQVASPSDILLQDPACLRSIFVRVQDNKLNFHVNFRSNDMYSAFPANLAAVELMKQYMASEINVENGEILYISSGSHVYDYAFDIIETLRGKNIKDR